MKKILSIIALLFLLTGTAFAADQTIAATEEMVGSGHATKTDTLNRLPLVEHNTDGTHKSGLTLTSSVLVTPALGTPASGNLQNTTAYPGLAITAGKTITATQNTTLDEAVAMSSKVTKGGSGQVVNPTLPAFLVIPATDQNNIATGGVTVVWGTEVKDQAGNFASNTFTAPVTGMYLLNVICRLVNMDTAGLYYSLNLITSNRIYVDIFPAGGLSADGDISMKVSILADMDAADTVYVRLTQDAGTAQTDITVAGSAFSGYLAF